jgi:hypothetical protein
MTKHNISFEKANHTLKSDSLNIKQEGVVVIVKESDFLFIPKGKQVAFYNEKWSYSNDTLEELSIFIKNSKNIISLWDELDHHSSDCWYGTFLDKNSKTIITVTQKDSYYQNELVAFEECDGNVLVDIIQIAYEQNIVLNKIVYDIWLEKVDIVEFLKEYEETPAYFTKIGKLFFDVLPEDVKKKVSLNSFKS